VADEDVDGAERGKIHGATSLEVWGD